MSSVGPRAIGVPERAIRLRTSQGATRPASRIPGITSRPTRIGFGRSGTASVSSLLRERTPTYEQPEGSNPMGEDDKLRNAAEEKIGEAKEAVGKATDDEELESEGKADKMKGSLKQAGEKVKDAFK